MNSYSSQWTSWISIGFALLTLALVLFNYKVRLTLWAALLILSGSAMVVYCELFSGLISFYYTGCALLLVSVWVNGNLSYFIRRVRPRRKISITVPTNG